LPISVNRLNDSVTNSDFDAANRALSEEKPFFSQPLDRDTIAGYSLIEDVYGEPYLVLRLTMDRDLYRQGENTVTYFLMAEIVIGITFGLAVMIVLEKYVVSRVGRLATEVKKHE